MLGITLVQTGMYGEAIAAFQRASALTGQNPEILGLLGYGYGMAGMKREAQDVLKELDTLAERNRYVSSFSRATIYIGLGETDLAFKWLEQAYESDSGTWRCSQLTHSSTGYAATRDSPTWSGG